MCDQDVASVCTQDSCQLSHGHYRLSLFLLAEAARVKDVQGGALARSCKKRKATTQEVEAADPSLQEAGAGVDAFSIQSRIAVGRGADVLLTKDILRSTGLGCGVDTFGHVVRHRSVGEVRHRPFLLAHMQGIGCRPAHWSCRRWSAPLHVGTGHAYEVEWLPCVLPPMPPLHSTLSLAPLARTAVEDSTRPSLRGSQAAAVLVRHVPW